MNQAERPKGAESSGPTLFAPGPKREAAPRKGRSRPSLPADLRRQATRRMQLTAFAYAGAYLLADFFPMIFVPDAWGRFQHLDAWVPSAASILVGLSFAVVIPSARLGWSARVNLGLAFQVVASYGIALAMCIGLRYEPVTRLALGELGPGWVGVWMLFYTVLVPAPPTRALVAALGSASAIPVLLLAVVGPERLAPATTPTLFFFQSIFPGLICAMLAYFAARVIYQLGADVSRARELGSYRLEDRLGSGGMGEVWRASHQLLARPAAIKFIRPEAMTGSNHEEARALVRRFELEARATASLTSPHTVSLYDFGVTDDGAFYYVMELLDGLDLDDLVRRFGPLPPARVAHLLAQACESLDEAHARGLIHRDVKPANIYACRSGNRYDFVKVLDFGLVATHRSLTSHQGRLTLPEQVTGTPDYMAPEMARGEPYDGRADLYALGCVGYWLATGRLVFGGNTLFEIVSQHLNATPDPPSRHAPGGLPADLERLILACLSKSPADRPASARLLGDRLRAVNPSDRWSDENAERWWRANVAGERAAAPASAAAQPIASS